MISYQCFIFFTLLQLTFGISIAIMQRQTFTFPVPEISEGTSIIEMEWKHHMGDKTILLARIHFNKKQKHNSKIYGNRTGTNVTENGTLYIEDIRLEDSGNYSCIIIFHDKSIQNQQIYLQVLPDPTEHSPVQHNSTLNSTFDPSEPHVPETSLIAIPVCSALSVVLIVATIIIFRWRKKCCCTSKEPIYINKAVIRKARK